MISNQMDEDIDNLVEYSKTISPQKYFQDDEMYTNERDRLFNQFLNVFTQNYQKTSKAKHRMKIFFLCLYYGCFYRFRSGSPCFINLCCNKATEFCIYFGCCNSFVCRIFGRNYYFT